MATFTIEADRDHRDMEFGLQIGDVSTVAESASGLRIERPVGRKG